MNYENKTNKLWHQKSNPLFILEDINFPYKLYGFLSPTWFSSVIYLLSDIELFTNIKEINQLIKRCKNGKKLKTKFRNNFK